MYLVVITDYIPIIGHIDTGWKIFPIIPIPMSRKGIQNIALDKGLQLTQASSNMCESVNIYVLLSRVLFVFQEASSISMIWHLVWVRSKDIYIFIKTGATECHVSSISTRRKKLPATHSTLKFESYPTHVHIETDHSHTSRC